MKLLLILALSSSLSALAAKKDCSSKATAGALALETINAKTKNLEVLRTELLGSIMILTGYLDKFEVEIGRTDSSKKSFYQLYLNQANCLIQEVKKVEPFEYNN